MIAITDHAMKELYIIRIVATLGEGRGRGRGRGRGGGGGGGEGGGGGGRGPPARGSEAFSAVHVEYFYMKTTCSFRLGNWVQGGPSCPGIWVPPDPKWGGGGGGGGGGGDPYACDTGRPVDWRGGGGGRAFRARYEKARESPIWLLPASGLIQKYDRNATTQVP